VSENSKCLIVSTHSLLVRQGMTSTAHQNQKELLLHSLLCSYDRLGECDIDIMGEVGIVHDLFTGKSIK
jgi:hypothetical protein